MKNQDFSDTDQDISGIDQEISDTDHGFFITEKDFSNTDHAISDTDHGFFITEKDFSGTDQENCGTVFVPIGIGKRLIFGGNRSIAACFEPGSRLLRFLFRPLRGGDNPGMGWAACL